MKHLIPTYCFVLLLLIFLHPTEAQSQTWTKIQGQFSTGDTIAGPWSWEVKFVSRNVGWLTWQRGKIFKTTDGGQTWILKKQTRGPFLRLFALDSLHMWARLATATNRVMFTSDGGTHWDSTVVDSGYSFMNGALHFFSDREGLLFGHCLYSTTDGGEQWKEVNCADSAISTSATRVDIIDQNHGWIAGPTPYATHGGFVARLIRTATGWQMPDSVVGTSEINGFDMVDTLNGYIVGYNRFEDRSYVLRTIDGGKRWAFAVEEIPAVVSDVAFINRYKGWIVGAGGLIWQTTDGGNSWLPQESGTSMDFWHISVLPEENLVYVMGDSGVLLRADNITGVTENKVVLPETYVLHQNYPNPFNPTTLINYELPEDAHVVLKVYNMLGQEVATLVDEDQSAGYKVAQFDAQSLSTGVYIYRISAGAFNDVKKMLLVR